MKKLALIMIFWITIVNGWEINTHRAIDKTAMKEAPNLTDFVTDAGIKDYPYTDKESNFDGYGGTYKWYATEGEELGVSNDKWNQKFVNKNNYVDLIELGTILEDVAWPDADWIVHSSKYGDGDGRFNSHYYNPQDGGSKLSFPYYGDHVDAVTWANDGASFGSYFDKRSNEYSLNYAKMYFEQSFMSEKLQDRRKYQAKMFVALGHILHMVNDMDVPAHTRDDSHAFGDSLEVYMRGGQDANEAIGYRVSGSEVNNNLEMKVVDAYKFGDSYDPRGELVGFMKKEAKFSSENFYSGGSVYWPFGNSILIYGRINSSIAKLPLPDIDDTTQLEWRDTELPGVQEAYIVSNNVKLEDRNKLAIVVASYFYGNNNIKKILTENKQMHGGSLTEFRGDMSVLADNGYHLIPRAIANAAGFVNYFFRGRMEATPNAYGVMIKNASKAGLVANDSVVSFQKDGTIQMYYDENEVRHPILTTPYKLKENLDVEKTIFVPIDTNITTYQKIKNKEVTIVYSGDIGQESSVSVCKAVLNLKVIEAQVDTCSTTIKNIVQADSNISTFQKGGTIELFYNDKESGKQISILESPYTLTKNLPTGESVTIPTYREMAKILDSIKDNNITVVYKGKIGADKVMGVDVVELPDNIYDELPEPNEGIVEITLSWDKPHLDYDLVVEWDAGEVDIKDTICGMEHFHILSDRQIKPGTYRVNAVPKDSSDKSFEDNSTYPLKVDLEIKILGSPQTISFDIKKQGDINLGHIADIKVYQLDDNSTDDNSTEDNDTTSNPYSSPFIIVSAPSPECPDHQATPPPPPIPVYFPYGIYSGWSFSGLGSGNSGSLGGGLGGSTYPTSSNFISVQPSNCSGDIDCLPIPSDDPDTPTGPDIPGISTTTLPVIVGGMPVRDIIEESYVVECESDATIGCMPYGYKVIFYRKQIYFGPLRDANFTISTLEGYRDGINLYKGQTTKGETLYDAGEIDIPDTFMQELEDDKLYIIQAIGGEDIDTNDDFVIDNTPTPNKGQVYAIASGKDIKYTGFKVNILTTVTFELLKEMIAEGSTQEEIEDEITLIASRLLRYKIYPNTVDSNISNVDLLAWLPTIDKDLLLQSYTPLKEMVSKIYAGENIYEDAYKYVYFKDINSTDDAEATVIDETKPPIIKGFSKTIAEDALGGTVVGSIEVLRGSEDISFGTLSGKGSEDFEMDNQGEIRLKEGVVLDYETKWLYKLQAEAINKNGGSGKVGVYISVGNVLDAPEYRGMSGGSIDENATEGTIVAQLSFAEGASPIDSIEMLGDSSHLFTIDNNGTIRLAQGVALDYESKYSYGFIVLAKNSYGSSMPVILYISVNDIPDTPTIKNYTGGYVHEDATEGTIVAQVIIDEGGSAVTEVRLEGDGMENFTIDLSGTMRVSATASLDYESILVYRPKVTVTNSYGEVSTQIFISVINTNDVPSLVLFTGGNVKENSSIGTVVGQLDFDAGSMPIESMRLTGEGAEKFRLLESGTLVVAQPTLNYEEKSHYILQAVVSNALGDSLPVTMHIFIDDDFETFAQLEDTNTTAIDENTETGSIVGQVNIIDEGSSNIERFELIGVDKSYFSVDNIGVIRLAKVLDYEQQKLYTLEVKAKNGAGFSSEVTLSIPIADVADVKPILNSFVLAIDENITANYDIGTATVQTHGDRNISTYRLSGPDSNKFIIDTKGVLQVRADNLFDYETKIKYLFGIIATNEAGDSNEAEVTVNINNIPDVKPILNNTTHFVDENTQNAFMGNISILDSGDAPLTLFALSGAGSEYFTIDENGHIQVNSNAMLDYELQTSYTLQVNATNAAGVSNDINLTVNIQNLVYNDDEPILDNTSITIDENVTIGSTIGQLIIETMGTSPISSINLSGIGAEYFSIEPSGSIIVKQMLDYESKKSYTLTAIATNAKADSPPVTLIITLTNVVDFIPVLAQPISNSIDENATIGTEIVTIVTNGEKPDENVVDIYTIASGDEHGQFSIDVNGTIYIAKALDYETITQYTLEINATNRAGVSEKVSMVVDVNNVIDFIPVLLVPERIGLDENTTIGREIATITLNGEMPDENITRSYHIINGNENGDFIIDEYGVVYLDKALQYTRASEYNLSIVARNEAGESMPVILNINVSEVVNPFLIAKIVALDTTAYNYFGNSVAVDGNYIVIGASGKNTVYLFEKREDGSVEELASFKASDGYYRDNFGDDVAIDGKLIVVGAQGKDTYTGAAYLFEIQSDDNVTELSKLVAPDRERDDKFSSSVAVSGHQIAIGAYGDDDQGSSAGAIYLFEYLGDNSVSEAIKLTASDGEASDSFGWNIAMSGDLMVVGAKGDDDKGSSSGAVYLFEKQGDVMQEISKFTASDTKSSDGFGAYLDIDGNHIVVANTKQAVYWFERDQNGLIIEHAKITASDAQANDYFGTAVAIDNNLITVGAFAKDSQGVVYLFQTQANGSAVELLQLKAFDGQQDDNFGISVAISGNLIITGAKGEDTKGKNAGATYVYDTKPLEKIYIYGEKVLSFDINENFVGLLQSIQANSPSGGLIYNTDGEDASYFTMIENNLTLPNPLDYESWLDSDTNNSFEGYITIEDISGNSESIPYTVKLEDSYAGVINTYLASQPVNNSTSSNIAMENNLIVIGSPTTKTVHILEVDSHNQLIEIDKITNTELNFGFSVAIDGDYIVVGSPYDGNSGAIYLYKREGIDIIEIAKISSLSTQSNLQFGRVVSISGNLIIIGAEYEHIDVSPSYRYPGASYLFEIQNENNVSLLTKLQLENLDNYSDSRFGHQIALDKKIFAISAANYNFDDGKGAVYIYEKDDNGSIQIIDTLTDDMSEDWDEFGYYSDIDGDYIVAGSRYSPTVYLYKRNSNSYQKVAEVITKTKNSYINYITHVSIKENMIVIGADDTRYGSVIHYFKILDDGTIYEYGIEKLGEENDISALDMSADFTVVGIRHTENVYLLKRE